MEETPSVGEETEDVEWGGGESTYPARSTVPCGTVVIIGTYRLLSNLVDHEYCCIRLSFVLSNSGVV